MQRYHQRVNKTDWLWGDSMTETQNLTSLVDFTQLERIRYLVLLTFSLFVLTVCFLDSFY